ncbi:MAG: peptidoglycan DD-metalloendopeptidase family protein [Thermoanaerobaculales bacterium]|nr:peptidoglycan DD-metalloendopeptidase family protein [Thermoanaerobaculales bacterium]
MAVSPGWSSDQPVGTSQIDAVKHRVKELEQRIVVLAREKESAQAEREQISVELELAEARVSEIELELTRTRDEAVALKKEAAFLADELELRRDLLETHLEMVTLLGRPGPLQLLWDGVRGGDLEEAVGVVVVLATGQAKLVKEYRELRSDRAGRLAELSVTLQRAGREVRELLSRREQLENIRRAADIRLARLDRSERKAGNHLAELREREAALERLFGVVSQKKRFTGREDVRRFRGALPWPTGGVVVRTFGKHFVSKYATYTVCNGLRFSVEPGAVVGAVFPGQVAFARHFKGYGNMVVVDHGHEVYSLVAGLASIHVRVNQQVDMGTRLGQAGNEKDDGNLYLEIRVGGKPENPKRWLQLDKGNS